MDNNKTQSLFTQEITQMPEKENQIRCMGCMEEFSSEFDLCPNCGYVVGTAPKLKTYLRPGTLLTGRYILGNVIGQGGFGITYIGWDSAEKRKVAVKEFFPSALSTREDGETNIICYSGKAEQYFKEGVKKMLDEGNRLSGFTDNPNIVNVYDYFEENSTAYIVMEYLEGKNLKDYAAEKGGRLDPREAVNLMLPVIGALEEMHAENMIHRDIAPDNIYMCNDGKIKLLDFGSARIAVQDAEKSLSVMVKPGYAPKEQYASRSKQGPWTDVYSVCATLYKLITGESPVESIERETTPLKTFEEFGVEGERMLENLLIKGLEPEPEDRIQNATALKNLLMKNITASDEERGNIRVPKTKVQAVPVEGQSVPSEDSGFTPAPVASEPKEGGEGKKAAIILVSVFAALLVIGGTVFGIFMLVDYLNRQPIEDTLTEEEEYIENGPYDDGYEDVYYEETTEPVVSPIYLGNNSMYFGSVDYAKYTFYAENSGEYVFESNNDSGDGVVDLEVNLWRSGVSLAENDDYNDRDFRVSYNLSAGDTVTLVVKAHGNEVPNVNINVSYVSYALSLGSNSMKFGKGYDEYVTYTFTPDTSGYYSFESNNPNDDFSAHLYCDGSEIDNDDDSSENSDRDFKAIGYCSAGSDVMLDVRLLNDYTVDNINISVSYVTEEEYVAIEMYKIFKSEGYYVHSDESLYKYNPSYSSDTVSWTTSETRTPMNYVFSDNTLWLEFSSYNDYDGDYSVWYPIYISSNVKEAYYIFEEYNDNGMYFEPSDKLYYQTEIQDVRAYFLNSSYQYPETFVLVNGELWIGFEMDHKEKGDIVVWYPM